MKTKSKAMVGWICLACGKCHSPLKSTCDCPGLVKYEISGTSNIQYEHNWTKSCCGPNSGHTGPCQWKCDKCGVYRGL